AFCQIASPVIGRKVNKAAKLIELYETALHSIGLPVEADSLACKTFQIQLRRYQEINACRKQLEETAQAVLADNPDSAILQSVPGIGPINALTILAEGGDLRRFSHHRQFLKYCGFDLAKNQSGN
ncbi:IS110 family transposase, partial [Polynucleobacter wuianus]